MSNSLVVIAAGQVVARSSFQIWAEAASIELKQTASIYVAGYVLAVVSNGRPLARRGHRLLPQLDGPFERQPTWARSRCPTKCLTS